MMHLLFPDEAFCMEMLDTEWQVFTCFDYIEPIENNEPKTVPTYNWSGTELTISGITPTKYAYNIQLADGKIYSHDGADKCISNSLENTSFTDYTTIVV